MYISKKQLLEILSEAEKAYGNINIRSLASKIEMEELGYECKDKSINLFSPEQKTNVIWKYLNIHLDPTQNDFKDCLSSIRLTPDNLIVLKDIYGNKKEFQYHNDIEISTKKIPLHVFLSFF